MSNIFKTVLLVALPASGKSEVRNFMANIDPEILRDDFHIGENLQLDDFPYVHFMRRIDDELRNQGKESIFYPSPDKPFYNNLDWGTVTNILNEDYHNMKVGEKVNTQSYALYLFERIDRAASLAGIEPRIASQDDDVIMKIADILEEEAKVIVSNLENQYTEEFHNRTVIIECARGGPDGAQLPLTGGYGYQYTLPTFSSEILDDAAILYIWVTPEESRRKNNERANPDDPSSNLFHGVPIDVMLGEYGCDDMAYLLEQTEVPDTITVEKEGQKWHVPIGIFDNRVDKTSFLREDKEKWDSKLIEEMTNSVKAATDAMWSHYNK